MGRRRVTDKTRARLDLIKAALGTVVWVLGCGVVVSRIAGTELFQQHPIGGRVIAWTLATAAGLGGLWGFWSITSAADYCRGGYRVNWLPERGYVYEEFDEDGMLRALPFGYQRLENTYAPPCLLELPTAEEWSTVAPGWAHSRRDEIVLRLTKWAQRGYEPTVRLVPPSGVSQAR